MFTSLRFVRPLRALSVPLGLAILFAAALAWGEPVCDETSAPGASEAKSEEKAGNYAKTPDSVIPYRHFQDPYAHFFDEMIEFLGTGRYPGADYAAARVGFLAPVAPASDADIGQRMFEGVQLAFEQANAGGGYNGTPFELVVRQDIGLWGASSNEMTAFGYEDDVLAVIGSIDGGNTHIALRVALKMQIPMVNTATTDPTLTETAIPWLLRCMADDRQQGYALAQHIYKEQGIKSVVALRVNDRYGRMGMIEFRDAAQRLGYPLRAELRWDRGERNFDRQLDRIARIGPEAIVLWGNASDAAAVVREIRKREMPVRIFGCDRLASPEFLDGAGETAEGIAIAASYDPTRDDPRLRKFVDAYTKRFQRAPETFAAHGYDGANILIASIRKAGLNRARIRDALYEYREYRGVTGLIEFDATLNDVGPVYIATIEAGRLVYREMEFAMTPREREVPRPYRAMAESPPGARSPVRGKATPGAEIRVGCFLPLDDRGRNVVRGMERAVAEDLHRNPTQARIVLVIRDSRGAWGDNNTDLVDMVTADQVIALVGSTERRGTHLAETIAARMHFPVLSLCGSDPTITAIPIPWAFCVTPGGRTGPPPAGVDMDFALGYDTAALLVAGIREGGDSRRELRDTLAADKWYEGMSGTFKFDALGNRVDKAREPQQEKGQP